MLRVLLFHLLFMRLVGLTLGLIAHVVIVVLVVEFPLPFFCIWRYTFYMICVEKPDWMSQYPCRCCRNRVNLDPSPFLHIEKQGSVLILYLSTGP